MRVAVLLVLPLAGQSLRVDGPSSLRSGMVVMASIELLGSAAAGIQFSIDLPTDVTSIHVAAGPQAVLAGKVIDCSAIVASTTTCVVYGTTSGSMSPGIIGLIFGIRGSASSATGTFRIRAARVVDAAGGGQAPLLLYQPFPPEFRLNNPNTGHFSMGREKGNATS